MWSDAVITNAGKALLASWAGGGSLSIDSAAAGTGTVSVASLMAQTALVNEKQAMSIVSMESVASGIRLKLQITSAGVTTSYTVNQMGVKASLSGGASTLLALFQDSTGITVPTYAEMPDFVFTFYAILQMSNTGTLTVTIDASAVVTQATLDAGIAAHDADADAHADLFAEVIAKSEATEADQVLVSTGSGAWSVKTLAQFKSWLAITASNVSDFAASVRATVLTGLSMATNAVISSTDTVLAALGKLQAQITSHTGNTSNPHSVTLAQVGAAAVVHSHSGYVQGLTFSSTAVSASAFVSDATYTNWPYRATVALTGVTADMVPSVVFSPDDAVSGVLAPVADSYAGGVYLYANAVPEVDLTIPTITCTKEVA